MSLILTECLPYNFVLREGILTQPELDHLVLCVYEVVHEAVARVNQL